MKLINTYYPLDHKCMAILRHYSSVLSVSSGGGQVCGGESEDEGIPPSQCDQSPWHLPGGPRLPHDCDALHGERSTAGLPAKQAPAEGESGPDGWRQCECIVTP